MSEIINNAELADFGDQELSGKSSGNDQSVNVTTFLLEEPREDLKQPDSSPKSQFLPEVTASIYNNVNPSANSTLAEDVDHRKTIDEPFEEYNLPDNDDAHSQEPGSVQLQSQEFLKHETSQTLSKKSPSASLHYPSSLSALQMTLPQTSSTAQANSVINSQQPRMELHDAFAYLDKVKSEFSEQPEVYNKFLQIMREFKANVIDANGVIYRVVTLFRGHKALIQGFNAFLPKTHHIDPTVAETGILPAHILASAVHSGLLASSSSNISTSHWPPNDASAYTQPNNQFIQSHTSFANSGIQVASNFSHLQQQQLLSQHSQGSQFSAHNTHSQQQSIQAHPQQQVPVYLNAQNSQIQFSSAFVGSHGSAFLPAQQHRPVVSVNSATLSSVSNLQSSHAFSNNTSTLADAKKSSPQFHRAIGYVKKIKHRFTNEPEIYKAFLAALHSYHKEQRSIHDVFGQIASLFRDHPDLLDEFIQFLPEHDAAALGHTRSTSANFTQDNFSSQRGTKRNAVNVSSGRIIAHPQDMQGSSHNSVSHFSHQSALGKHPPKRQRQVTASLSREYSNEQRGMEEIEFFDQVRNFLGSRTVYAEFLKCLNLFSQDILKQGDLLKLAYGFIGGHDELFGWFKRYIGVSADIEDLQSQPKDSCISFHDSRREDLNNPELNLNKCRRFGSYRIFPKGYVISKASGRTSICDEVLNDFMVSCPSFTSEDSTFVSSKKNQFEEAMFRCEDERFEMDLLIEHNLATIAVLEPLLQKTFSMNDQEKSTLSLNESLGGTSKTIYRRAIHKIYGDKAEQIYFSLMSNPVVAVPIVLARLKQKDEEWRRIQRDWNRIWRDVHLKNFYKALDHQGIDVKLSDRKSFTCKALIAEIECIAQERKLSTQNETKFSSVLVPHIQGSIDPQILADLVRLIRVYLRETATVSTLDRRNIMRFIRSFLTEYFGFSLFENDKNYPFSDDKSSSENDESDVEEKAPLNDKEAFLRQESNTDARKYFASVREKGNDYNILKYKQTHSLKNAKDSPRLLYANNSLFALVRLVQIGVDRLLRMKNASGQEGTHPYYIGKKNVIATFLDLQQVSFPEWVKSASDNYQSACAKESSDHQIASDHLKETWSFYQILLRLLGQLLAGHLETSVFEERVRFMFGINAYPIFTFDRLISALIKQIQSVLTDSGSEMLLWLFESWRMRSEVRPMVRMSEYSIRMAAESLVNPRENLFRIEYYPSDSGRLCYIMLNRISTENADSGSAVDQSHTYKDFNLRGQQFSHFLSQPLLTPEAKWTRYVDQFVRLASNAEYLKPHSPIFLNRNFCRPHRLNDLRESLLRQEDTSSTIIEYNLECKIGINTYKLFFVENTEDFVYRQKDSKETTKKLRQKNIQIMYSKGRLRRTDGYKSWLLSVI